MKIAFVVGTFFPEAGGAQVQAHNICNKLVENKIETECYIFNKTNIKNNKYKIFLLSKFLTSVVFFFKYYLNLNLNFLLIKYLKKIIKKNKYDFWHFIFLNHKCLILIDCLKQLDQKILVTFQGADIQIDKKINYGFRLDKKYDENLKKILKNIEHFFYVSNTVKKDLISLNIPENKMSYFPNSVEVDKFKNYNREKINPKKLNLITVARYSPKKKGYDILVNIGQMLLDNKIDFEWKIIGKDTHNLQKYNIIKENLNYFKIYDHVENIDETYYPNSTLIKFYMNSDLYINLSRIESFGITFIESLASMVPILSFDTKGANEIIKQNENGFLVNNDEDLLAKIQEIAENKTILENMKSNLLDSIKKFDLNLVTEKYERFSIKKINI
tara:strand:- start:590 stop:1747 length:1158 start_codon:yes stop_codon:yes gene_type:complete